MSAMISAAVVGVAGAAAVANQSEIAGRAALADQTELQKEGMEYEERMFMQAREDRMPWVQAGETGLGDYQNLMTLGGQQSALDDYYSSGMYSGLQNQANANVLRNQSAQGGLRGGSTYSALENSAVDLGQNYLSGLQNQNLNLANMGMGMAGQNASGYQQLGTSGLDMYNQMGANTANQQIAAANNQASMINSSIGMLGNAAVDYFDKPKVGGI